MVNFGFEINCADKIKQRFEAETANSIDNDSIYKIKGKHHNYFCIEARKIIRNIYIKQQDDSWIAIVGAPIINVDRSTFSSVFFERPANALLNLIDGHFAVVAYHAPTNTVYAATDCNSFIPVYYTNIKTDRLAISGSELFLAKSIQSRFTPFGFAQAINLGVTVGDRSRFAAIKKLRAGELFIFTPDRKVETSLYWDPGKELLWPLKFEDNVVRWKENLKVSVEMFANQAGASQISADLTGGEDSRIIVSQCHDLGIPYSLRVGGFQGDTDIEVAKSCASVIGVPIEVTEYSKPSLQQLSDDYLSICLSTDGLGSFFTAAISYATLQKYPPLEYSQIHLCGMPGGEAYRGTYYLRAKLLAPEKHGSIDFQSFARLKFLLDVIPNLVIEDNAVWREEFYSIISNSVSRVQHLPKGLQIDHLLREFQTSVVGQFINRPFYLPLGLMGISKSIYQIPPSHKKGSRLTRAVTEDLFPKLAFLPTSHGNPTVRVKPSRLHLFFPGYYSQVKKNINGVRRRLIKQKQRGKGLSIHHRIDHHSEAIDTLFNEEPFKDWFHSAENMLIGEFCNTGVLDKLLQEVKEGKCGYMQGFGRLVNAEITARYLNGKL